MYAWNWMTYLQFFLLKMKRWLIIIFCKCNYRVKINDLDALEMTIRGESHLMGPEVNEIINFLFKLF